MGDFAHLHLVEASVLPNGRITLKTSIYSAPPSGQTAYFSWGSGRRPLGLTSYGSGTIFCDTDLTLGELYPLEEEYPEGPIRLYGDYHPSNVNDPIVFHFVLPENYIPSPTPQGPEQPDPPFIYIIEKRVLVTYATRGSSRISFWTRPLDGRESMDDFSFDDLFKIDPLKMKHSFEFGVPGLKYKFETTA